MPVHLLPPGQRLRALWALDTTPRPGVSEHELVAFEQRAGFQLPAALRDYLRCVEGCANSFAEFVTLYETSDGRLFG